LYKNSILHTIEPYYNWRHLYIASEDPRSPFYGNTYSEFEYSNAVYNYFIHPQWDCFGSATLYLKILMVDYKKQYAIIELIGEWNDCLYNDIKFLKENVIDILTGNGINKFILIGENILNFHYSDDLYYQEWFDDIEDGWIACVNFRDHVVKEFEHGQIDYYLAFGKKLNQILWRKSTPLQLFELVSDMMTRRLNP
jgi:hypothetical protein